MSSTSSGDPALPRFLVVRAGGRLCALPVACVLEVLRAPQLAATGDATPGLAGFATLRGEPSAVFELAVLLGLSAAATAPADRRAVRMRLGEHSAALLVDEVLNLQSFAPEQITHVDLPGAEERQLGRFDAEFAQLIALGGLLPEPLPEMPRPTEMPSPFAKPGGQT